jgi:hypothetical protein
MASRTDRAKYKKKRYDYCVVNNLCVYCGKNKSIENTHRCKPCSIHINKMQRERRERNSLRITDELIDKGLITIVEASEIMGVCKCTVLNYIRKGKLRLQANRALIGGDTFWVSELAVHNLLTQLLPNIRCIKCGHSWHTTRQLGSVLCPKLGCRSNKLELIIGKGKSKNHQYNHPTTVIRLLPKDINEIINERLQGNTVTSICLKHNICVKTFYKYWRQCNKNRLN